MRPVLVEACLCRRTGREHKLGNSRSVPIHSGSDDGNEEFSEDDDELLAVEPSTNKQQNVGGEALKFVVVVEGEAEYL